MQKPNYCEQCKYQFNTAKELLNHVSMTHPTGPKSPNPSPVSVVIAEETEVLSRYLAMSLNVRENFGVIREENGGEFKIVDHDKFMKMDAVVKERLVKAIELANRRIKK